MYASDGAQYLTFTRSVLEVDFEDEGVLFAVPMKTQRFFRRKFAFLQIYDRVDNLSVRRPLSTPGRMTSIWRGGTHRAPRVWTVTSTQKAPRPRLYKRLENCLRKNSLSAPFGDYILPFRISLLRHV